MLPLESTARLCTQWNWPAERPLRPKVSPSNRTAAPGSRSCCSHRRRCRASAGGCRATSRCPTPIRCRALPGRGRIPSRTFRSSGTPGSGCSPGRTRRRVRRWRCARSGRGCELHAAGAPGTYGPGLASSGTLPYAPQCRTQVSQRRRRVAARPQAARPAADRAGVSSPIDRLPYADCAYIEATLLAGNAEPMQCRALATARATRSRRPQAALTAAAIVGLPPSAQKRSTSCSSASGALATASSTTSGSRAPCSRLAPGSAAPTGRRGVALSRVPLPVSCRAGCAGRRRRSPRPCRCRSCRRRRRRGPCGRFRSARHCCCRHSRRARAASAVRARH